MGAAGLDVVIPGAQKAGTSSLLAALGTHPHLARHRTEEFPALLRDGADLEAEVSRAYPADRDLVRLAKCAGLMHDESGLRRLHQHFPSVRLIFMLREPVSRMYSAYWYARRTGDEPLKDFSAAVRAEGTRTDVSPTRRSRTDYRQRSEYLGPLLRARELFGRDQMHIMLLEDYARERGRVLLSVIEFLGLEQVDLTSIRPVANPAANASSERVARMLRHGRAADIARHVLPERTRRPLGRALRQWNERSVAMPAIDVTIQAELRSSFVEHNTLLADAFGLDLSVWGQA